MKSITDDVIHVNAGRDDTHVLERAHEGYVQRDKDSKAIRWLPRDLVLVYIMLKGDVRRDGNNVLNVTFPTGFTWSDARLTWECDNNELRDFEWSVR